MFEETINSEIVKNVVGTVTKAIPPEKKTSDIMVYKIPSSDIEWERNKLVGSLVDIIPTRNKEKNTLYMGSSTLISPILDVAKQRGLTGPKARWLFVVTDSPDKRVNVSSFAPLINEGENIAFMYNTTDTEFKCRSGVVCHVEETLKLLGESLALNMEEESLLASQLSDEEWDAIRPTKEQRRESLLNYISTQLRTRSKCGNCSTWSMETSQSWGRTFTKTTREQLLQIGYWSPTTGPVLTDHLFPHVSQGFRAVQLPIATFHSPPWQVIKINESGHEMYGGVIFEIITELSQRLNFTYEIINFSNITKSGYGSKNAASHNKSIAATWKMDSTLVDASIEYIVWNQTVKAIKQKQIFLGGIGFTVTEERKEEINFTNYVAIEPYAFLTSRPKYLTRALLFLQPFTTDTWLCIVAAIAVVSPLLYVIHTRSPFYDHYSKRSDGGFSKMINCFWYVYGAFLQQGGGEMPLADSGRLVIGTWWLVVLVLVTTYCGNLVAFLTFPRRDTLISNVDELMERRDILTWGMPTISPIHSILSKTNNEKLNDLSDGAILHDSLTNEIIAEVREGHHIYIDRKSKLLFLMKNELLKTGKCQYAIGDEQFLAEKLAMIVSKDNPYLELLNQEIVRMHKVGLIQKWIQDYLPPKDKCYGTLMSREADNHKVNLDDMQGSFFLLFFGVVIGVFIILGEYLYKKWRNVHDRTYVRPFAT